jgi:hypothetical protein
MEISATVGSEQKSDETNGMANADTKKSPQSFLRRFSTKLRGVFQRNVSDSTKYLADSNIKNEEEAALSLIINYSTDSNLKELGIVVIGGWAVWAYTRLRRSSDVDIVLSPEAWGYLEYKAKEQGFQTTSDTNSNMRKHQIKTITNGEHIDIDSYVAYQDELDVPPQELLSELTTTISVCFKKKRYMVNVPTPEALMLMKLKAYNDTKRPKHMKDIFGIIFYNKQQDKQFDPKQAGRLMYRYGLRGNVEIFVDAANQIVNEVSTTEEIRDSFKAEIDEIAQRMKDGIKEEEEAAQKATQLSRQ